MQRTVASLLALLSLGATAGLAQTSPPTAAPVAEIARVLTAYRAARPAESELGIFRLDWAASLKEARARAAREKRPIFFVSTMQLKDAGDLQGGHC